MNINEILEKLKSDKYFIEFELKFDTQKDCATITGALKDKNNPIGFGRYEFFISNKEEQKVFLENILNQFHK